MAWMGRPAHAAYRRRLRMPTPFCDHRTWAWAGGGRATPHRLPPNCYTATPHLAHIPFPHTVTFRAPTLQAPATPAFCSDACYPTGRWDRPVACSAAYHMTGCPDDHSKLRAVTFAWRCLGIYPISRRILPLDGRFLPEQWCAGLGLFHRRDVLPNPTCPLTRTSSCCRMGPRQRQLLTPVPLPYLHPPLRPRLPGGYPILPPPPHSPPPPFSSPTRGWY